ncbi:CHAT domain-containing protein [Chloroflexia bacterium SDU3-3]|nr:CHAT domain-containing protein [Chloroflexia bacterium SDU3-3]
MPSTYRDIDITFQPREGGRLRFQADSDQGQASGELPDLNADSEFQELLLGLRTDDTSEDDLITLGKKLYSALFQGEMLNLLMRVKGALSEDQGIRLKLRTAPGDAEVAVLPWEFLFDPQLDNPFVLLGISVVRYPQAPVRTPSLECKPPLRLLLTGAQPSDMPNAEVDRELDAVIAALKERKLLDASRIEVVEERHLTRATLQRRLREGFQIWHFAGHGGFSRDKRNGVLFFEDSTGSQDAVSARELGILMSGGGMRLIVLDACESGARASAPFRSISPSLIANGIPAVISMQFAVPEESTTAFAGEFYYALSEGLPIDACVTEGRKAVVGISGLRRPDWGIPTVYTRASDGVLFQLPKQAAADGAAGGINMQGANVQGNVNISSGNSTVSGNTINIGTPSDVQRERESLQQQLSFTRRRSSELQKQKAIFGFSADPSIIIQLEETEKEIAQLEQRLRQLSL